VPLQFAPDHAAGEQQLIDQVVRPEARIGAVRRRPAPAPGLARIERSTPHTRLEVISIAGA
jgi:hypothetical protein